MTDRIITALLISRVNIVSKTIEEQGYSKTVTCYRDNDGVVVVTGSAQEVMFVVGALAAKGENSLIRVM